MTSRTCLAIATVSLFAACNWEPSPELFGGGSEPSTDDCATVCNDVPPKDFVACLEQEGCIADSTSTSDETSSATETGGGGGGAVTETGGGGSSSSATGGGGSNAGGATSAGGGGASAAGSGGAS